MVKNIVIAITIILYLLGRICDDLSWHEWHGISHIGLEIITVASLIVCAILITIKKIRQNNGLRVLLFESQRKFIIPWGLIILQCALVFNIFNCAPHFSPDHQHSQIDMERPNCILYVVALLVQNYIYSSMCHYEGDLPYLIVFQVVLFAEVIYDGQLLVQFVNQLQEKPKDYSILFISIMIAWDIIVMDLLIRSAFEEKNRIERIQEIEKQVVDHYQNSLKVIGGQNFSIAQKVQPPQKLTNQYLPIKNTQQTNLVEVKFKRTK